MAVTVAKSPAIDAKALRHAAEALASSASSTGTRLDPNRLEIAEHALPVYDLGLTDLAGPDPLASARLTRWRYLVRSGNAVAIADTGPEGGADIQGVHMGAAADELLRLLVMVEANVDGGDGELRLIEIPALNRRAVWVHGDRSRFGEIDAEGDPVLRAADAFLSALTVHATAKRQSIDRMEQQPLVPAPPVRARAKRTSPAAPSAQPPQPGPALPPSAHFRRLTILAQDPQVRLSNGSLAFAEVDVPAENLAAGPMGYRVKVVDYDATSERLYKALASYQAPDGALIDPFRRRDGETSGQFENRLLSDPNFHAQNVYAIVLRTLARFERALGRRVAWSFDAHQLHVVPHAFCEPNAFYSERDRALMFGYFTGKSGSMVFTSLSHDVVAHETTHALLDGLRNRFSELSLPDQAAFHEGFADVVALLSAFSLEEIVATVLDVDPPKMQDPGKIRTIAAERVTAAALKSSILFGLAKQVGSELEGARGNALRRSVTIEPDPSLITSPAYEEEHVRGEIFVAGFMQAFLAIWCRRIDAMGTFADGGYNLRLVVAEGVKVADHLLTMAIRALDYCPPTDIDFDSYLTSLLTADSELVPDDSRYDYRQTIRESFAAFGIHGAPSARCRPDGTWLPFDDDVALSYARSNFEAMLFDSNEVFRFVWDNRQALGIGDRDPIEVGAVCRSQRIGPDGLMLREVICEYVQIADIFGSECAAALGTRGPPGMPMTTRITAYGGGALVFDHYGRLKYHIAHPLKDGPRQLRRLVHLYGGATGNIMTDDERLRSLHRARAMLETRS